MSNTKDTPMDYTIEQFFEYVAGQMAPDGTNMSIDDEKLCYKAMEEYANQQNASLKLELQKQKELNASYAKEFALTILNDLKDQLYQVITVDIHEVEVREIQEIINKYNLTDESLIKKSSEV